MLDAVIVDAVRTPIGRAFTGSLRTLRADDLAAAPLRALAERNPRVDFAQTDDVLLGAASGKGEQGYNLARHALLLAGIDDRVPAVTINRRAASSLEAVRAAFHAIRAGEGEQFIAAGAESTTRAGTGAAPDPGTPHHRLDGSRGSLYNVYIPMGLMAESVAERFGVSREEQDRWAVISQDRAIAAAGAGHAAREIAPVTVPAHVEEDPDGAPVEVPAHVFAADECARPGTTMDVLAALRPAFSPSGTVTAGNACPLADGAAALLVMSDESAARLQLRPRARIVATAVAALEPEQAGLGSVPAVRKLLERTRVSLEAIDIVELDEAFAATAVACARRLGLAEERLNPFGGAIAFGEPLGMAGARLLCSLLNGLEATGGRLGLAASGGAGGVGEAVLVERL